VNASDDGWRSGDGLRIRSRKPGDCIQDLDTPVLLVDLDRMEKNIRDWQACVQRRGVAFRPHIKTHKVPEIALLQVAAGARGIISAKISEAEPFAEAGIREICIAYPVFGEFKWRRVAKLAKSGVRVTVNCDSEEAARGLSKAAACAGVILYVQIDVDSGFHRGGVPFQEATSIERLARKIRSLPGLELDGLTTFRANGFAGATNPQEAGHEEGRLLTDLARKLREAGIEIREVTAGSTPTAKWAAEVEGITEVRAGTYVFNDLMQLGNQVVSEDDLALSVLCTVVSRQSSDRLTIDGGTKTFSGDAAKVVAGTSLPLVARAMDRQIFVERLTEEHGMARTEEPVRLGRKGPFHPLSRLYLCQSQR
jgi:D-serine deaminase-like pyridoxal phosphate-dependent protein